MILILIICEHRGKSHRSLASLLLAPLATGNKPGPGTLRRGRISRWQEPGRVQASLYQCVVRILSLVPAGRKMRWQSV